MSDLSLEQEYQRLESYDDEREKYASQIYGIDETASGSRGEYHTYYPMFKLPGYRPECNKECGKVSVYDPYAHMCAGRSQRGYCRNSVCGRASMGSFYVGLTSPYETRQNCLSQPDNTASTGMFGVPNSSVIKSITKGRLPPLA